MEFYSIPPEVLREAYLLGKTPFRACAKEPRISYSLYVPQQYFEAYKEVQLTNRESGTALKLVVNVHGTRREAAFARDSLIPLADSQAVAILAPLFPAGLDGLVDLSSYKTLNGKTYRADEVLLSILDEVSEIWPAIDTTKVILVGFSGGAQFAHRMVYLHPQRFEAVAVGAPGSVTMLSNNSWPKGVGNTEHIFDKTVDTKQLALLRFLIFVGSEDTEHPLMNPKLHALARGSGDVNFRESISNRLTTAQSLHRALLDNGVLADFRVIPGVAHDYAGTIPTLIEWLMEVVFANPASIS